MKRSASIKALLLVTALGMVGTVNSASATDDDDPDPGEVVIGIIGGVIEGANEAEQEKRCERLEARCEDGSDWACDKLEESCF